MGRSKEPGRRTAREKVKVGSCPLQAPGQLGDEVGRPGAGAVPFMSSHCLVARGPFGCWFC